MMEPIKVYNKTAGLVTDRDPFAFDYNPDFSPIAECSNIDVTDNGKIRLRGGRSELVVNSKGVAHSGHPTSIGIVFVEGNALSVLAHDGTITRLRVVTEGYEMSCVEQGPKIWYSNTVENGFIEAGVAYNWVNPAGSKVSPPRTTKVYGPPPAGYLISKFKGHVLVAYDNFVFICEPWDGFNCNRSEMYLPFGSRLRMLREVEGGLWVGTEHEIFFCAGTEIQNFDIGLKHLAPVIKGTDVYAKASDVINNGEQHDPGVIVTAEDAILFLTPTGQAVDISGPQIDIPRAKSGTAMFFEGKYITKMNTIE
jgi:hypothetical protein